MEDSGIGFQTSATTVFLGATVVFAAYLRLSYVTYGLPYLYNGDEMINFRIIQSMLERRSLDPEFFNYPSLLFYLNLPAQFLVRNLTGELPPLISQSMGNGYTPQPVAVLSARLVTVGFGIATVAATWRLAQNVGLRPAFAFLAAILVSATPMLVRHSSYVTPDMFAAFFATATLSATVTISRRMDWRIYALAGALAGLAAASKYNAGLVALSIPVAHVAGHGFKKIGPMVALAAAASVLGLLAASPYLVLDHEEAIRDFLYELRHYRTGHPGAEGNTLKTNALWLFREAGWTWLFLPGLAMSRSRWPVLAPVAIFTLAYLVLLSMQVVRFDRNLLPMLPAFFVLLASGAQQLTAMIPFRSATPVMAGLFAIVATAGPVGKSISDLGHYVRDPRAGVREWLESYTHDGKQIAVDAYSPYLKGAPGARIVGKYSVLALPLDLLVNMDYVVVRKTGLGRFLDTGTSPQSETFNTLSARACETANYPPPPARPAWTVLRFNCP